MMMIDLRSDTVTRPTAAMRAAMAAAEVGDDVYGEDPTINRLQERAAGIFEKEAALFVPSGTMGNQIAVKVHTRPGQEIVIEERGHILNYELGASAIFAGVTIRPVRSADGSGILTWPEVAEVLSTDGIYDHTQTGLLCLENTHNLAGGTVMSAVHCAELCENAHSAGIRGPHGRGEDLQRRRSPPGQVGCRADAALRLGAVLPVEGVGCPGRFCFGGLEGIH
jgi:threonine aldolase